MATLIGTPGLNEELIGSVGVDDTASFVNAGGASGGVVVDLGAGYAFDLTNGDFDTLTSIENVTGSAFDDTLVGDAGANVLDGGAGVDQMFGGDGNDTLNGGDGGDFLYGEAGNDTLHGGAADDLLDGGLENDTLFGDAGNDSLMGDAGNDTLVGGAGNDTLNGGLGADVFNYSFNLAQSPGSGSTTTYTFTDWLSAKYGKDFGDHLPDYAPSHDKHGKHQDHDNDHKSEKKGKDDKDHKSEKNGKDDKAHNAKDHGHKDGKDDGHHGHEHGDGPSADTGLTQSFFAKNYTEWLRDVVVADLLAQGLVQDVNGNGKIDIGLNQNDPLGTPSIEGLSAEQLAGMFSDRDGVVLKTGEHGQERFYSNDYTSTSGGETTVSVTSGDGLDTIVDFAWGEDHLEFNGLGAGFALADFTNLFVATETDVNGDTIMDTTLALTDGSWEVTLLNVSTHTEADFYAASIFS